MRSSLVLLAGLAGSALALPTASPELDARTFGLVEGLVDTVTNLLQGQTPAHILGGISSEAAAALGGGALGCKAGSIDLEYRKKLVSWLKNGAGADLESSLRKELLSWCEGDSDELDVPLRAQLGFFLPQTVSIAAENGLYMTVNGVFSLASETIGVLTATAQATLETAIKALGEIDWKVRSGLEFCAAGGVVNDLDAEIVNAMKAWLNSSKCTFSTELQKTVISWIQGDIGGDVIHIPSLPVGGVTAISLGHTIEALVEGSGALVSSAQASLSAFLQTDAGLGIEDEIKDLLHISANGGSAIKIEVAKRIQLALWLSSSKCTLTSELKGLLIYWLSQGVDSASEVSLNVGTSLVSDLTGFLTGTIDSLLGTQLHGLISFILSGKGVLSISQEARTQLIALVSGGCGIEITQTIQEIIIGWLTGCQQCCGGSTSSNTPSLPSSTSAIPASSTPSVPSGPTSTGGVPTGVQPTESPSETSTPCDTLTSESETPTGPADTPAGPTDVQPTESPSETSTPCDTLTSESVISSTISIPETTPAGPTDSPAVPTSSVPVVPSGPADTETPEASSTPCETLTSESVVSSTISIPEETPAPTNVEPTTVPTSSIPVVPSPANTETPEASSTPCETITSESVISSTISVPEETPVPTPAQPTTDSPADPRPNPRPAYH
ncbi:hypothetical protein ASPVEDRAFT_550880 [Aspergillus versicolor CBS 583.65]|uniref:Cell wall protein n=1 Tax=Aspergillus versicolor CBS 583.65 TaxID=1036611 RepID=A0A1L9PF61_ASPVE|nr:uncharacterized protein ASPVEDRAFT_550880 [Aspergillus versicolor CBS 583.65]OJJ00171.1 hypothetical protein ASPVEDRAFT_550880 [Aspergillus versicolor CBS 583.65]